MASQPNNDISIHKAYKELLSSIKPLIPNLSSTEDARMCLLWLVKLDEATGEEAVLRNELLKKLQQNLKNGYLKHPFTVRPPKGCLDNINGFLLNGSGDLFSEDGTDREELNSINYYVNNCYCKQFPIVCNASVTQTTYEERAERAKAKICKYQRILKDLSNVNNKDLNKLKLHVAPVMLKVGNKRTECVATQQSVPVSANTEIVIETTPNVNDNTNVTNQIRGLEQSQRKIIEKCDCMASNLKSNISNKQECEVKIKNIVDKFRKEMQAMAEEKDAIIASLELKLQDISVDIHKSQVDDFDETLKSKCDELENKYRSIVDNLGAKLKA